MNTSFINRLFYGIGGGISSNMAFNIMGTFFIVFCVDVWGMNPVAAGTIVLVTRLLDTVTDPLMGAIADKTRSKFGKYRIWIMFAGPLTGLATFLIFLGPNLSPEFKVIYMYIVYIFYSLISTAANIPYHSLTAYITTVPNERRGLVIIKQTTAMVIGQLTQFFGMYLTITLFNNSIEGYRVFGLISGITIALGFMVCAYGAREVDNYETLQILDDAVDKFTVKDLFKQLLFIGKNASLRNIAIASSTNTFSTAITSAVTIYFYTIVLGDVKYAQTASLVILLFGILSYPVTFYFAKKFGNKEAFVLFTYIAAAAGLFTYIVFTPEVPLLMVLLLSTAIGLSTCANLTTWMMVTDCADDIRYQTGKNGAGIASSCLTFSNKLGSALGGFCTGLVLAAIGYNASAAVQEPSVASGLLITMIFAPILGHVGSILAMKFYPLSKTRHAEIQAELYGKQ